MAKKVVKSSLRHAPAALVWVAACALFAGAVRAEPLPQGIADLVRDNRQSLTLEGESIGGPGGARLLADARDADLLMFGENHGVADIARFAQALYVSGTEDRPRRLVVEVGRTSAEEAERLLREGSLREFLSRGVNLHSLPFYFLAEELPLLEAAVAARGERGEGAGAAIWGVDQEFMAAAPLIMERLKRSASTPAQENAVKAFRRASRLNPFLVGMGDGGALQALRSAFPESPGMRALAEDLVLSHRIYREQMGGDAAWANERREALMMENFIRHVEASGGLERAFLKFGSFHLYRGRSPSTNEAFGAALSQWAEDRGLSTLSLYADCAGGQAREMLLGRSKPCESFLSGSSDGFHRLQLDEGWTLFDLRPLREAPGIDELPTRMQLVIRGYDYLLLIPEPEPSNFLPGRLVPHVYGAFLAALMLGSLLLLWLGFRAWRRRRLKIARKNCTLIN